METMDAGDMHQTRALLEKAIGARVHTGTVAAIDPLPGRDGLSGRDWVMLALSGLVRIGGVAVSLRLRPHRLPHPGPKPLG